MKDGFLVSDWADDTIGKRIEEKKGVCVPRCVLPQHTGVQFCPLFFTCWTENLRGNFLFSNIVNSSLITHNIKRLRGRPVTELSYIIIIEMQLYCTTVRRRVCIKRKERENKKMCWIFSVRLLLSSRKMTWEKKIRNDRSLPFVHNVRSRYYYGFWSTTPSPETPAALPDEEAALLAKLEEANR
jgi:hypothetical protein